MIRRSEWLFQVPGAVVANRQEAVRQRGTLFTLDPIEALAQGRGHGCGQGFPGSFRELFGETMCLWILDVQSHLAQFYL
jgi:hypothetical protein